MIYVSDGMRAPLSPQRLKFASADTGPPAKNFQRFRRIVIRYDISRGGVERDSFER
jgi:hypothetical protein